MRISTNMVYELGSTTLSRQQLEQVKLQQHISSGKRVLTPSDDPVAAASALETQQAKGLNDQYHTNAGVARDQLALEESALGDATSLLQDVKTLAVYAGNGSLTNADRLSIAAELEGHYAQLLGIANRTDGNGHYLFSGYQGATRPFSETAPGTVAYAGDSGTRNVQISASRVLQVSDAGDAVFFAIRNGNGTFEAAPGAGNTGSGIIGPGTVTDPAAWNAATNGRDFTIRFHVDNGVTPPVTTYDIVDNVNNVSLTTGAAPAAGPYLRTYVPGGTISLARQVPPDTNPAAFDFGAGVPIDGVPASGDTFTVQASVDQDVFTTLHDLITTLRTGRGGDAVSAAAYQNALNAAMSNIDNAHDRMLTVRAQVGARLKEVDIAQSTSEDLSLAYSQSLSRLQDLDYAKALSELALRQTYFEAAQKSFLTVTSLDLFKLL
jgi:flagellar hook-associated protein 3 FlgL